MRCCEPVECKSSPAQRRAFNQIENCDTRPQAPTVNLLSTGSRCQGALDRLSLAEQPHGYFKRIRMVWVKRPRSDCLFFCPVLDAGASGSRSQWPEQAGQNTRLLPPANRSTCTQSSQKTFSHLTHLTMARAS